MRRLTVRGWMLLSLFVGLPADLLAGEPAIRNLSLHGLQIGSATTLVVDGDELGTAPRLLLPFPARQQLKSGSTKNQATFDVNLDASIEPGYYHLRIATDEGVSVPVLIAVDRLPQRPLGPRVEQLPMALHGTVTGSATVETQFQGKAKQKLLVEVEAQRLGSKLRPVVHLLGPRRLEVAWGWPRSVFLGDTRLEATLPEDGLYTLAVHDLEYAAPAPSFFRLRVGQWSFSDYVFPPAVAKGRPQTVQLLGTTPAPHVDLPAFSRCGPIPVPTLKDHLFSGPRPFVLVSPHAEVVKQVAAGKIQELPGGTVGVSGRLLAPYDEDRYRVPVTPRTKLRLEVFAERSGSPLDVALVVRNEQGAELARAEDSPGTLDPVLEYTVPDKVRALVVGVVDSQGRGGPQGVYRIVVEPRPAGAVASAFRLITPVQRVVLGAGGRAIVPVLLDRGGADKRVELAAEGLPDGVNLEGTTIPEDADGALVTVRRGSESDEVKITRWIGRTADGEELPITLTGHPLERLQPWLATEVAVAATLTKGADFQIDWGSLPAEVGLVPSSKLTLPVKVTKPAGSGGVRLTLLTSQVRPLLNGQTDPNQSLRLERPVELPAGAAEGALTLVVPPLLPAPVYDISVQAELLSTDKKTVLAVAAAPVRRMSVRHLVVVRLDGPDRVETILDPQKGATVKLQGQIERREGLTGDVTLTLTGLPAGASAAAVTVKAGTTAFAVTVVLTPGVPAGEVTGLKLSATAVPNVKQPNVRVRSRDVGLTLVVQAPAK